ncbi:MAG TPA: GNAT family N-acetyltransferase [Acidimicrobiales bacterium]|nr:GNAT family N-acetyltransferase [Acidimicrobiales bacterium]
MRDENGPADGTADAGVDIGPVEDVDHNDLFAAFARIVDDREGFPQEPPLTRADFDEYWLAHSTSVVRARVAGELAGAYYLKPNFVGRAAHIANAGYFVAAPFRGRRLGWRLVVHSLEEARRVGFDALQFNLVFESNPARRLYEALGFRAVGRVPRAVEGEDALIYWRAL